VFVRSLAAATFAVALVGASCTTAPTSETCTGTSPILRQKGTLTVAADLTYPPFAYDRPRDIPAGFEADLVRALAKQLKMDVVIANRSTSALVPGLLGHRHDLAAAGLVDTDRLREETCVSEPYMAADLAVLVPSPDPSAISEPGDLDGHPVAVLDGSRAEEWAIEHLPGSDIRTMPTDADVRDAVEERTVDGAIEEVAIARYAAKKDDDLKIAAVISTGRQHVFAAAPDNGALIVRINGALGRIRTSGRLQKIETKWLGAPE
jgi:polar amino acid transport system substrate-binding protein